MSSIYHQKHHIIPRHFWKKIFGNLSGWKQSPVILITIDDHIKIHKNLWNCFGQKEDELAYKGLSGMIGKEQIIREKQLIGLRNRAKIGISEEAKKKISLAKKGIPRSIETRRKISLGHLGKKRKPFTEQTKKRMSESARNRWGR